MIWNRSCAPRHLWDGFIGIRVEGEEIVNQSPRNGGRRYAYRSWCHSGGHSRRCHRRDVEEKWSERVGVRISEERRANIPGYLVLEGWAGREGQRRRGPLGWRRLRVWRVCERVLRDLGRAGMASGRKDLGGEGRVLRERGERA